MATIPVYSPAIPFLGLIPGGLQPGRMIRIKGIIQSHGERCQIHLQTGAALNPRDDAPLHISIRPHEFVIGRNSIQRQVIGAEERHGGCPVRVGESFDLLILAESTQYKLAINGVHFCTFSHRLPLFNVKFISVSGGCVIYSILSEADSSIGSLPSNPYPPIAAPYVPPTVGFVPQAPLPPPPPYTPTPTYPIVGGGGGHYPGHGWPPASVPPPPPPQPAYPHPVYPTAPSHPPAVPFSNVGAGVNPSASPGKRVNKVNKSIFKKTQDFLQHGFDEK